MRYFMVCGDCRKTTFGLTKKKANGDCPKCGGNPAIVDRE